MRIRNVKNKEEILNNCSFLIENPKEYKGRFNELFGNDNPIYLEIGMGKGKTKKAAEQQAAYDALMRRKN